MSVSYWLIYSIYASEMQWPLQDCTRDPLYSRVASSYICSRDGWGLNSCVGSHHATDKEAVIALDTNDLKLVRSHEKMGPRNGPKEASGRSF